MIVARTGRTSSCATLRNGGILGSRQGRRHSRSTGAVGRLGPWAARLRHAVGHEIELVHDDLADERVGAGGYDDAVGGHPAVGDADCDGAGYRLSPRSESA